MPYASDAQRRFFHAAESRGDISPKTVREFDRASRGKDLPERKKQKKSQPTSSQVHVPAPMGNERRRVAGYYEKAAHNREMLRQLRTLLDQFFAEEEVEKGDIRRVASVAVVWDGRVLMGKRRDNQKWTFPGGHVNPEETLKQGAIRELREETGIECDPRNIMPLTPVLDLNGFQGDPLQLQCWVLRLGDRPATTMMTDPDGEVLRWRWMGLSKGLTDEIYESLHVPPERNAMLKALNLIKKSDDSAYGEDNLEKVRAAELVTFPDDVPGSNCANCRFHEDDECKHPAMDVELVDGAERMCCDYWDHEGTHHWGVDVEKDRDADDQTDMYPGIDNLEAGFLKAVGMDKDTTQNDVDPDLNEGYALDIGSGTEREPGHLGIDLYPYDADTMVHDVSMGLPFPDQSTQRVRLVNSLDSMEGVDPQALLAEIQRVLKPGGQFVYEGPDEIYDEDQWVQAFPGLVLTNHEDSEPLEKSAQVEPDVVRHVFTRVATPDPATAQDSEPRLGVSQYTSPVDALMASDALGYYWSDATSSGRGNRALGYASQGGLTDNGPWVAKDEIAPQDQTAGESLAEAQVKEALQPPKPVNPKPPGSAVGKSRIEKMLAKGKVVPILKAVAHKQIVYGVILAPNEIDAQEDFMEPEEIEKAAHRYLMKSRVIGSGHDKPIDAEPVESFIAPQDLEMTGQYGPQVVKKGSWILGVKVHDPQEWQKIVNGEYTGFSVGGLGAREQR